MGELAINTIITGVIGLLLGGVSAYLTAKYKGQKDMVKCTEGRLDVIEKEIVEIKTIQFQAQRREIINTYRFYKPRKKIPVYEMEEVEGIYKEYSKVDDNGIIKKFMEQMRSWATSEEKE